MNQFFIPLSVKKEDYRILKTQELWGAKWEVDISKVEKDDNLKKIKNKLSMCLVAKHTCFKRSL